MEKSQTIAEIAKALSSFQGKITAIKADAENPHFKFKYADLASIWEGVRKPLTDCGLSLTQHPETEGQTVTVRTMLLHLSGEYLESSLSMQAVNTTPQAVGSAITYARRYAMSAMLGISSEEDDDGEAGTHGKSSRTDIHPQIQKPTPQKVTPKQEAAPTPAQKPANGVQKVDILGVPTLTEAQLLVQGNVRKLAREKQITPEDANAIMLTNFGTGKLAELNDNQCKKFLELVNYTIEMQTGVPAEALPPAPNF